MPGAGGPGRRTCEEGRSRNGKAPTLVPVRFFVKSPLLELVPNNRLEFSERCYFLSTFLTV